MFESLFGDSGSQAATLAGRQRKKGIKQAQEKIEQGANESLAATNTGYDTATGNINTGYDTGIGDINAGYDAGGSYLDQAHNYLDQGTQQAVNPLNQAATEWQTLLGKGNEGIDNYGMYSPDKGQAGLDAFHNSTDYLNSRAGADAGTQALLRAGAGQGQVGRMQGDLASYLMQYDRGILQDVRNAYNPYFTLAQNAATGYGNTMGDISSLYSDVGKNHATVSNQQANLATGRGTALSNLATGRAGNLSDLATGRAGDLSNIYTNRASNLAGLSQAMGNSKAQATTDRYAADATRDSNWFGLLSGGLQAGLGFV